MKSPHPVDRLLTRAWKLPAKNPSSAPGLVYGAGSKGRGLAQFLKSHGLDVLGVVDRNADTMRPGWTESTPLLTPHEADEILQRGLLADLYIGIHNYAADLRVVHQWAGSRFEHVFSIVDILGLFPDWPGPHYWAWPAGRWQFHRTDLVRMFDRISDEAGRSAFLCDLAFRLGENPLVQLEPSFLDQYAPDSLPPLEIAQTVIDCGAFNGDSLEKIARRESIEAIVAFEPDESQLVALTRVCERIAPGANSVVCAGVWDEASNLKFNPIGPGSGTFIEIIGDDPPNTVSIDQYLTARPERPTLIKMDIEGAELKALKGARRTICEQRPALALSAYHKPEDLWALADWVEQLDLGYRFTFRSHGRNNFDLVLYARTGTA